MAVTVRPARLGDEAELLAVDRATWTPRSSPAPVPDWTARRAFFGAERGPEGFLVACEGPEEILGYVGVHADGPSPSHDHVVTIDGLGVFPHAQHRGVGRQLVEAALDWAARRGSRKVTLRVLSHNHVARRLYERCGFVTEGVLHKEFVLDDPDGRRLEVDDVLMARWIG